MALSIIDPCATHAHVMRVHFTPTAASTGEHSGRYILADGPRDVALKCTDHGGRWLLDIQGNPGAAPLRALVLACAQRAEEVGALIEPGAGDVRELLTAAGFAHVLEAPPPRRTSRITRLKPSRAFVTFGARVAERARIIRASAPQESERRKDACHLTHPNGEAHLALDGSNVQLHWAEADQGKARYGWVGVTEYALRLDADTLDALGAGRLDDVEVEETRILPDAAVQLEDVRRIVDEWVSDETVVLHGDPGGRERTRAVHALAQRLVPLFAGMVGATRKDERKQAAARCVDALVSDPGVEAVHSDALDMYWKLKVSFWEPHDG